MSASLLQFAPVGILLLMAIAFVSAILILPRFTGKRTVVTPIKDSPYECGMPADTGTAGTFGVKFYLVAMIFIVFDLEVVFILGWATSFRDLVKPVAEQGIGTLAFWAMLAFIAVLEIGHFYLYKKGALTWGRFTAKRRTALTHPTPSVVTTVGQTVTADGPVSSGASR